MTKLCKRMTQDLRLPNYADQTIRAYTDTLADFAASYTSRRIRLASEEIRHSLLYLLDER